jgi:hypothetical protein
MTLLDSLLRKQRLQLAEHARELHEATQRRHHAEQAESAAGQVFREAQAYLSQQLFAESLCPQRLAAAKVDEQRRSIELAQARRTLKAATESVESFEQTLTRAQKHFDKLEETRDERRVAATEAAQQREWRDLDEWITTRHGVKEAS